MKEFKEFQKSEKINPPRAISESILSVVKRDLEPSALNVFSKLSLLHFVSALITLSVCPQFGFRIFGNGMGLMHYFNVFGVLGCTIACGSFFMGMTLVLALMVLRVEEIRVVRAQKFIQLGSITLLSLGFFVMVSPSDVLTALALVWSLGSMLAGFALLEVGYKLRRYPV